MKDSVTGCFHDLISVSGSTSATYATKIQETKSIPKFLFRIAALKLKVSKNKIMDYIRQRYKYRALGEQQCPLVQIGMEQIEWV
eukprot:CAMPEP_0184685246 /NCGR_PEP_ID=MMETSP0312-20130426/18245_1 /TAXON_ID=31354 /ORGANISM="Compsopogon coeruleus, Strain SAG 36.94" /LENGTH=83 /DNA_ID=CAMNT_0027139143 /DNA_START=459 /DNA_END=710 /DNA_ORIENTATION=-